MKRKCDVCSTVYEAKRPSSRFCSATCRKRASRGASGAAKVTDLGSVTSRKQKRAQRDTPQPAEPVDSDESERGGPYRAILAAQRGLVETTRARLEKYERLETIAGQQAMFLAEQLRNPMNTAQGVAAISKEFRVVMEAALEGVEIEADPLDELRLRRDAKRNAG